MRALQNSSKPEDLLIIRLLALISVLTGVGAVCLMVLLHFLTHPVAAPAPRALAAAPAAPSPARPVYWQAADLSLIADPTLKAQVTYGQELIAYTARYLGPQGSVRPLTNGMNCQNCHLDAGTRVFGNNYGSVASQYPKFRARSGTIEDLNKRVNDCMERSLNGRPLDTLSNEMAAIRAYITYIGSNVPRGQKAPGSGLKDLPFLDRAADPAAGVLAYQATCQSCHQGDGQGLMQPDGIAYTYPPLWGPHSYNDAAGLFRITNLARYIKYNMPLGATHEAPVLSDEEAWDIAAYINSQPRPHKNTPNDWPDISQKPLDHPFGPYADAFSARQHKYGPFKPIQAARKAREAAAAPAPATR